jgi:hypothetical protein
MEQKLSGISFFSGKNNYYSINIYCTNKTISQYFICVYSAFHPANTINQTIFKRRVC